MVSFIIKNDTQRAAETATLGDFGINARTASAAQREMAEQITADNKRMEKDFNRMEEKSK